MLDPQYETTMRENMKLERDCSELKEMLEQERAEKSQLMDQYNDNKNLISKLSKELDVAKRKLTEELVDKRERRVKYEAEMERLRQEIERRQREIEDVQATAVEPMDMDIFRLKAKKEFENSHAMEMQERQNIIDQIKQERDELKRNLEFLNTKHDNLKFDSQRDLESSKLKFKEELQMLIKENQNLQSQLQLNKDRENLRQCRRDLEDAKRRMEEYQKECIELRKLKDATKDQMNDLVIQHNREIEAERSRKREAIATCDQLKFKIRALEDDLHKQALEGDKKSQSIIKLKTEKQTMSSLLSEKELAYENAKRQLTEVKDELRDKESELQSYIRRKADEDADFELVEKRRFEKMQNDLDTLSKQYKILEVERAQEREKHFEQFNRLEYNYKLKVEEIRKLTPQVEELKRDLKILQKTLEDKSDELNILDREYQKFQDQNRQLLVDKEEISTRMEDAKLELKLLQEKTDKSSKAHEMSSQAWLREKKDMELRIVQLIKTLESYKSEGTKDQLIEYKKKTNEYKRKVRAANETIAKLGRKLAILGSEHYQEEIEV